MISLLLWLACTEAAGPAEEQDGGGRAQSGGCAGGSPEGEEAEVVVVPRSAWALVSPYNLLLTPDLDGDGTPQIVTPGIGVGRGFDVWDVLGLRDWNPTANLAATLRSAQASHGVTVAGDLNADGLPDLMLFESKTHSRDSSQFQSVVRWWSVAANEELGRLAWDHTAEQSAVSAGPPLTLPDYDGDGVPEQLVQEGRAAVFRGSSVGPAMGWEDTWFTLSANVPFGSVLLPDGDGDGLAELAVPWTTGLVVLYSTRMAEGNDVDLASEPVLVSRDGWARGGADWWLAVDLDGDGLPELAGTDGVLGRLFLGVELAAALDSSPPVLTPQQAWYSMNGGEDLGTRLAAWGGGAGPAGLVVTEYFDGRLGFLGGEAWAAGGEGRMADLEWFEEVGWFGYALGQGVDVDCNGSLDLLIGAVNPPSTLDTIELWLFP